MSTRTNLVYLPCCYGDFDCYDEGKGCIHKKGCKAAGEQQQQEVLSGAGGSSGKTQEENRFPMRESDEWAAFVAKHTAGKACEQCGKQEGDTAINSKGEPYTVHLTVDHPYRWAYKSKELYLDFEASMCRVVCRTCNSSFERGLDICPKCRTRYKRMGEPLCRSCYFEAHPEAKALFEQGQNDQKERQRNRSKIKRQKKNPHPCDRHHRTGQGCKWPGIGACPHNRANAPKNLCGHYKVRREAVHG